jgi:hypothetical protein
MTGAAHLGVSSRIQALDRSRAPAGAADPVATAETTKDVIVVALPEAAVTAR